MSDDERAAFERWLAGLNATAMASGERRAAAGG